MSTIMSGRSIGQASTGHDSVRIGQAGDGVAPGSRKLNLPNSNLVIMKAIVVGVVCFSQAVLVSLTSGNPLTSGGHYDYHSSDSLFSQELVVQVAALGSNSQYNINLSSNSRKERGKDANKNSKNDFILVNDSKFTSVPQDINKGQTTDNHRTSGNLNLEGSGANSNTVGNPKSKLLNTNPNSKLLNASGNTVGHSNHHPSHQRYKSSGAVSNYAVNTFAVNNYTGGPGAVKDRNNAWLHVSPPHLSPPPMPLSNFILRQHSGPHDGYRAASINSSIQHAGDLSVKLNAKYDSKYTDGNRNLNADNYASLSNSREWQGSKMGHTGITVTPLSRPLPKPMNNGGNLILNEPPDSDTIPDNDTVPAQITNSGETRAETGLGLSRLNISETKFFVKRGNVRMSIKLKDENDGIMQSNTENSNTKSSNTKNSNTKNESDGIIPNINNVESNVKSNMKSNNPLFQSNHKSNLGLPTNGAGIYGSTYEYSTPYSGKMGGMGGTMGDKMKDAMSKIQIDMENLSLPNVGDAPGQMGQRCGQMGQSQIGQTGMVKSIGKITPAVRVESAINISRNAGSSMFRSQPLAGLKLSHDKSCDRKFIQNNDVTVCKQYGSYDSGGRNGGRGLEKNNDRNNVNSYTVAAKYERNQNNFNRMRSPNNVRSPSQTDSTISPQSVERGHHHNVDRMTSPTNDVAIMSVDALASPNGVHKQLPRKNSCAYSASRYSVPQNSPGRAQITSPKRASYMTSQALLTPQRIGSISKATITPQHITSSKAGTAHENHMISPQMGSPEVVNSPLMSPGLSPALSPSQTRQTEIMFENGVAARPIDLLGLPKCGGQKLNFKNVRGKAGRLCKQPKDHGSQSLTLSPNRVVKSRNAASRKNGNVNHLGSVNQLGSVTNHNVRKNKQSIASQIALNEPTEGTIESRSDGETGEDRTYNIQEEEILVNEENLNFKGGNLNFQGGHRNSVKNRLGSSTHMKNEYCTPGGKTEADNHKTNSSTGDDTHKTSSNAARNQSSELQNRELPNRGENQSPPFFKVPKHLCHMPFKLRVTKPFREGPGHTTNSGSSNQDQLLCGGGDVDAEEVHVRTNNNHDPVRRSMNYDSANANRGGLGTGVNYQQGTNLNFANNNYEGTNYDIVKTGAKWEQ